MEKNVVIREAQDADGVCAEEVYINGEKLDIPEEVLPEESEGTGNAKHD